MVEYQVASSDSSQSKAKNVSVVPKRMMATGAKLCAAAVICKILRLVLIGRPLEVAEGDPRPDREVSDEADQEEHAVQERAPVLDNRCFRLFLRSLHPVHVGDRQVPHRVRLGFGDAACLRERLQVLGGRHRAHRCAGPGKEDVDRPDEWDRQDSEDRHPADEELRNAPDR